MIGNDIVDLQVARAQSNWQRPGFLDKIFSTQEQLYIKHSDEPHIMVWQLWSAKEASYKLYTQLYPSRFYNPKGFECTIASQHIDVFYSDFFCKVTTVINSKYILSKATLNDEQIKSKVITFNALHIEEQSARLKIELLKVLAIQLHLKAQQLQILKDKFGIPSVWYGTKKIAVSLSHHGAFGAFCFGRNWFISKINLSFLLELTLFN